MRDQTMMEIWPAPDVKTLCAHDICGNKAEETGLCGFCESVIVSLLKTELGTLDAVAFKPVEWYRKRMASVDLAITRSQAHCLKLCVIAEFHSTAALDHLSTREAQPLANGNRADVALRDVGRGDVRDAPENRERRAALMDSLTRVNVGIAGETTALPTPPVDGFGVLLCLVAGLLCIVLLGLG